MYAMDLVEVGYGDKDFNCLDLGFINSEDTVDVLGTERADGNVVEYLSGSAERYVDGVQYSDEEIINNLLKIDDGGEWESFAEEEYEKGNEIENCIAQEKEENQRLARQRLNQSRISRNFRKRKKIRMIKLQNFAKFITGKSDPEKAKELVLTFKKNLNLSELDPAN